LPIFTVKREDHGLVSRWLHDELRVGDEVEIEAPNGTFCFTGEETESVVLIGGGVGITPMMSVARYLTETRWPGKVYLVLGFQVPRDFIFRREIAELRSRNANLSVTVTMSRSGDEPWSGAVGRIDAALLASAVPDVVTKRAHICGPPQMMESVKAALVELGVPNTLNKTEAFDTVKRNPIAKGAVLTDFAGRWSFRLRTQPRECQSTRRSSMWPTRPASSSTTPAAREHVGRVASSSYRAL